MTNEPGLRNEPSTQGNHRAVFLSYASDDANAAARIAAGLRAAGIEVWFDQSALRSGDAWDRKIRRQIRDCALFIPIISRNTQARREGYFRLEWHLADQRTHLIAKSRAFLLPVCIDGTPDADAEVPDSFALVQWTRLAAGETSPAFVARVSQLLVLDDHVAPAQPRSQSAPANVAALSGGGDRRLWRGRYARVAVVALAAISIAYAALDRFALNKRAPEPPPAPPLIAAPQALAQGAIPEQSIAVLPFADMSERKDQEYFSDGMTEEIIDLLVKVPELRVPARTSSFYFKGKSKDIPTIARRLVVAHVLEGSVRRSGNHLRVTAQLVRADTGYQLWSESYDRDVRDVFKVQNDIARVVVEKLKLTLLTATPDDTARAPNPELHRLYLQGRYFAQRETAEGLARATGFFQRAIALDPRFAPAWADLGYAYFRQVANGYVPVEQGLDSVSAAADKAMTLDPSLASPYELMSFVKMTRNHDWAGARVAIDKALQLDPTDVRALFSDAFLTRTVGSNEEALVRFGRVLERDPLNLLNRRYVARVFYNAGRLDEAEAMIRQVLDLDPSFSAAHYELGRILLARGQIGPAVAEFEAESNPGWKGFGLPLGYHAQGRTAEANAALAALVRNSAGQEYQIAETYAYFGDADQAFIWLDRAVDHDPGIQLLTAA